MIKCRSNQQPYPIYTTVLTGKNLPPNVGYRTRIPRGVIGLLEDEKKKELPPGTMLQKIIQTMFRESETQTDPYEVDVAAVPDSGLEILTLGWLSWENGLPAGMNEINTIERARQRRAWESALPIPHDQKTLEIREMIIEAMEINEWNYREQQIAAIGSLRMELAEKLMKERGRQNKEKYEKRLSGYIQAKREEKNKKIKHLRVQFNREIRKLVFARQKINRKYHRWNIIKQFADKTSELYAPQLRFGEDPRHWHEKIHPAFRWSHVFSNLEALHYSMRDIPEPYKKGFKFNEQAKPQNKEKELCIRSTRWTEENLEMLHDEMSNLRRRRFTFPRPCYLKKKVVTQAAESEIPEVAGIPDEEEEMFQACLLLQKIIKGRAIQAVMFEGRVKCQELIEELKSTHALQKNRDDAKAEMRRRAFGLQRQAEIDQMRERRKNEILCSLEGKTTADMLDFLAKELLRLQDEQKTQAMALAANQERHKREAAEAGRRQVEEQRRREHDEMFRQVMKVHQNAAQSFLEDVLVSNRMWLAQREGREYVTKIAKKIDQAALQTTIMPTFKSSDNLREEEIIADLIHNFALPEAEKRMVRKRLKEKQKNYLKICHDEVYTNIEKVAQGKRNKKGDLLPLPKPRTHKVPHLVRVKYLHLKRMGDSSSSSSQNNTESSTDETFNHAPEEGKEAKEENQPTEVWSTGFSRQEVILKADNDKV